MSKFYCTLLFLFSLTITTAQETTSFNFPKDALGVYKGTLHINSARGKQQIPMEFQMTATDSINKYTYKLIYNGQPRNYTLIVKDKEQGIYEVDENNGIILPAKLHDNVLSSFFEVQGNFLSTRMEFLENAMHFEILFTKTANKTTTGGTSKEIPEVFGFPISVVQKAVLFKE